MTAGDLLNLSLPQQDWKIYDICQIQPFLLRGSPRVLVRIPVIYGLLAGLSAPLSVLCNQSFVPPESTFQIISPRGPSIEKDLRGSVPPTSRQRSNLYVPALHSVVNRCSAFFSLWCCLAISSLLRLRTLLGSQWEMMFLSGAGQQSLFLLSMDNEKAPRVPLSSYFARAVNSLFHLPAFFNPFNQSSTQCQLWSRYCPLTDK